MHDLFERVVADDERRRQQHVVALPAVDGAAHRVDHQPFGHGARLDARVQLQPRIERLFAAAIRDQLDCLEQAAPADVADLRVRTEGRVQPLAQALAVSLGLRFSRTQFTADLLPSDLLGDAAAFLQDGMEVMLELWEERPISVELPEQIEATIVEADAVVKGQTASSSYKPAILDNGVRVMVPPHITSGTRIVVNVYDREYVRRAD